MPKLTRRSRQTPEITDLEQGLSLPHIICIVKATFQ